MRDPIALNAMRDSADPAPAPVVVPNVDEITEGTAIGEGGGHPGGINHANGGAEPTNGGASVQTLAAPHFARFRRFARFSRDAEGANGTETGDEQPDVTLELMLLREENARLKAERHRPPDVGTMIDQVRALAAERGDGEVLDEAWSVLTECLVVREGLEQACMEIQAAISAVRERLAALAVRTENVTADGGSASGQVVEPDALARVARS